MTGRQGNHKGCPYRLAYFVQGRPLWTPLSPLTEMASATLHFKDVVLLETELINSITHGNGEMSK